MKLYSNPRPRTNIDLDEMKRLRAQGYTIGQLAEHFSVSETTIRNHLRREGLTLADVTPKSVKFKRGRHPTDINIEELKRLRAQGYTIGQLAEHFGLSQTSIKSRLRALNRYRGNIDLKDLKRLRAQGYTIGQLAEHFGVSLSTITNHLRREGLTLADITPKDVNILPGRRIHHFDLDEVKRLRAMGYGATRIARELGVPVGRIYSRLKTEGLTIADITPEGVEAKRFSEENRYRTNIDIAELKRLRAQGYTIGQLAEHFGVGKSIITNRLSNVGLTLEDITPEDVNILPGKRIHHFDLEDVKRLRAMGYGVTRIARELGVPTSAIYSRLKTAGLTIADITPEGVRVARYGPKKDLPRDNPLQTQGSAMSKTVGFGVGATATTALDYALKKTTELSSTKRHLISGGTTTVVGLGVYATTKREDALWSAYGSIFATLGHLIYDKLQK